MRSTNHIPKKDIGDEHRLKSFSMRSMQEIHRQLVDQRDSPHRHSYYTVIWCKRGSGDHYIDFHRYELSDNTIFFVAPDQVHHVVTHGEPDGVALLFTPMFLERSNIGAHFISDISLFRDCGVTPPVQVDPQMSAELQVYVDGMWDAYRADRPFKLDRIGAFLKLFLIRCNESQSGQQVKGEEMEMPQYGHLVRQFKALVEANFRTQHLVQFYADQLNITANYLNEVIKFAIGSTAKQYLINRLVLEARREALYSEATGKEVGYRLGFDDPSAFSKFFKKNTEISFTDFRKSLQAT